MAGDKLRQWLGTKRTAYVEPLRMRCEGYRARFQEWSGKRVIVSERAGLEADIAKLKRAQGRAVVREEKAEARRARPSKTRFWWEGRKAAYRRWSSDRVAASEKGRLEAKEAKTWRKQMRQQSKDRHALYAKRMAEARAAFIASRGAGRRMKISAAAARALPRSVAVQATNRIWIEARDIMPDVDPRTITFHEGLIKIAQL